MFRRALPFKSMGRVSNYSRTVQIVFCITSLPLRIRYLLRARLVKQAPFWETPAVEGLIAMWTRLCADGEVPMAKTHSLRIGVALAVICMTPQTRVIAAPPENADQSLAPWFNSLSAADGTPCCSIADCRRTVSRVAANGYEALIDDTWVTVPPDRVLSTTNNVLCTSNQNNSLLCQSSGGVISVAAARTNPRQHRWSSNLAPTNGYRIMASNLRVVSNT